MSLSGSEIARLIHRARQGDGDALGQLLSTYRSYVELLARLQSTAPLQGKISPSDIVQETFIRAQRYFAGFRGNEERELMAWLRRNLASTIADQVRHFTAQKRDVTMERRLDEELNRSSAALGQRLPADILSPSETAERREQAAIVAEALNSLDPEYREVIVMRHLEGASFSDVARRMGQSVDSVKHLWTRGLARMRKSVGNG